MSSPTSRRSFLLGRRTPPSAWGQFCARLSRTCTGQVRWHDESGRHEAWLLPAREEDVLHALALCRQYRVQLMLDGCPPTGLSSGPVPPRLWVEGGAAWAKISQTEDETDLLRADGGCSLKLLQELGVPALRDANPAWNVAQWLASADAALWPPGMGHYSGIERISLILADGTHAVLGPFGADAKTPLRSLTVQKMIPRLFELASSPQAVSFAQAKTWPLRFRLDALIPAKANDINLAWLLAGHGAMLGWVQAVWFSRKSPGPPVDYFRADSEATDAAESRYLSQQLKLSFDPEGVFPQMT